MGLLIDHRIDNSDLVEPIAERSEIEELRGDAQLAETVACDGVAGGTVRLGDPDDARAPALVAPAVSVARVT